MGEIKYNHVRMDQAKTWISTHFGEFVTLTIRRIIWFWFAWTGVLWKDAFYWLMTVLGICGLFRFTRDVGGIRPLIIVALWLGYPIAYYLIQGSTRYRYPIDWTFLILTAYFVIRMVGRKQLARTAQALNAEQIQRSL